MLELGSVWGFVCSHEPGTQGISQQKSEQKIRHTRELILEEDGEKQKLSSWKRELCFLPISDIFLFSEFITHKSFEGEINRGNA